jgi:hypothetical protein
VVYPWVVDCAAPRDVGWHPTFSDPDALAALLAGRAGHHAVIGRRIARRDADITAAGAAAAVLESAAIVCHARKRNKTKARS